MVMFWIQFVLVLGAILLGVRRGGVALGLIGGLGVSVLVLEALERAGGNQTLAGRLLGISQPALNKRLKMMRGQQA